MQDNAGFTVLVVEDDPTHQILVRKALTGDDSMFSVLQFADDSEEAEHFARQMAFDVVLVDNRIPGRRGLDLISFLRGTGVDAPFVLMTSAGNEDLVVQAYRAKVADYIIKDAGFWRELPQLLVRVIRADRGQKNESKLRERLERANLRLDALNTDAQLQNQQLRRAQHDLEAKNRDLECLNERLEATSRDLGDFALVVASALDKHLGDLRRALDTLAAAPLADARAALAPIASILDRLRQVSPQARLRESPATDLDAVFERVQTALADRSST